MTALTIVAGSVAAVVLPFLASAAGRAMVTGFFGGVANGLVTRKKDKHGR